MMGIYKVAHLRFQMWMSITKVINVKKSKRTQKEDTIKMAYSVYSLLVHSRH